jgi:hypothetical protein
MKRVCILIASIFLSMAACKQEYDPILDSHLGAIVVEGLLTNLREQCKVKITAAIPYDTTSDNPGVLGATVTITDNLGQSFKLYENAYSRAYFSDTNEFVAVVGRAYTLQIIMPNGDIYKSAAQTLTAPAQVDSMFGTVTNKEYLYTNELGQLTTKMVNGSESFMNLKYDSDSIMQFRFDNTIMKCYSYWYWFTPEMKAGHVPWPPPNPCLDTVCPYPIYNWKKFNINTSLNLTVKTHSISTRLLKNNSVCFFPFANSFYPILIKKDSCGLTKSGTVACTTIKGPSTVEGVFLLSRVYCLNQAASDFYSQVNDQLSSQGKLFDPIAVQIKGNIRCVNNPDKLALGLFEVSSCTSRSYWMIFDYLNEKTIYKSIEDITPIPYSGASKEEPAFWQRIFH